MARRKVTNGTAHKPPLGGGEFEQPLPCVLTAEQHTERSMSLAEVDKQIDVVDLERREKAKVYSGELKKLRVKRAPLIEAVETRKEERMVRCREVPNWERRNVTTVRLDTQEVVGERAMEAGEVERHSQPDLLNGDGAEA